MIFTTYYFTIILFIHFRYGPPPSYPSLKVKGLNAPIPPNATFGYHPGGWGKPPVDERGVPLYGNVFGQYEEREESDEDVIINKLLNYKY